MAERGDAHVAQCPMQGWRAARKFEHADGGYVERIAQRKTQADRAVEAVVVVVRLVIAGGRGKGRRHIGHDGGRLCAVFHG